MYQKFNSVGQKENIFNKINVEGMEPKVLEGFQTTISKHKPVIYMELNWSYCVSSLSTFDACDKLVENGCRCLRLRNDLLVEIDFRELKENENLDVFFVT